jgi:metallophosphoesterase (TIGR03767 family)
MAGGGTLLLAALGGGGGSAARATERLYNPSPSLPFFTAGTTLEQAATPGAGTGYSRLVAGPGFPLLLREDLASAHPGRESRRRGAASIVQFTDLHIVDAQSPMRFEYLCQLDTSAFRPHEALGTQAASQLVERVNQLKVGPFSGRVFDCVVSTGDNSDNNESVELDWFLTVMNGGTITPNTGSATQWEGVQSSGGDLFYRPESSAHDRYKRAGVPEIPGFLRRAMGTHASQGLQTPWFSVFGNHDNSIGGTIPLGWTELEDLYTGPVKFTGFTSTTANRALEAAFQRGRPAAPGTDARPDSRWQVTPDAARLPFTATDFIGAHLDPAATGPGPHGHGFTDDGAFSTDAFYTFAIAPGVVGVALDSTNQAGFTHGSLGSRQFDWLDAVLRSGSSRYFDEAGNESRHSATDAYFVLFSHHTTRTMDNELPDPRRPLEVRHLGPEVVALVQRYPNVLAWVNGHTHSNAITAHHGARREQGFWEVNTASHIEFPQQARVIEVCDNADGTLSLFTTLIESAAPYQASYSDGSQAGLASLYREFSANDLNFTPAHQGTPLDRNTELLLVNPLA